MSEETKNRKFSKVLYSSKSVEWATPQEFFDQLDEEFHFTLDPCCTHENAKCEKHFTKEENGLEQDWGKEIVFMNPPYGRGIIDEWMQKAYEASLVGATVVCLVPARTDTRWFFDYAMKGEIRLVKGRIKFGDGSNSATFPSVIVIFRPPADDQKMAA